MDFNFRNNGAAVEVLMDGRFTFSDAVSFGQVVEKVKDPACRKIVLDLAKVDFIDSAALGMLLLVRDTAKNTSTEVLLRAPQGQVKRMLTAVKFDTIFAVEA